MIFVFGLSCFVCVLVFFMIVMKYGLLSDLIVMLIDFSGLLVVWVVVVLNVSV